MFRYFPLLLGLALLTVLVYMPGLPGPFLFDDFPNIIENDRLLAIEDLGPGSIQSAISQPEPGPIGRPVSFVSFAINIALTGLDPYYFKWTNLVLHVMTGGLVYWWLLVVLKTPALALSPSRAQWIGLAAAGLWMLHPINLTSVLYVVQRMTVLSSLFTLLTLLLYSKARIWQIERGGTGWRYLLGIPVAAALALFSKENGVLVFAYVLLLEIAVFRFQAKSASLARIIRYLFTLSVVIGAPLFLLMMVRFSSDFTHREFSLFERVFTETRVIWYYIRLILLPDLRQLTLFHDDFSLSYSLLSPLITLWASLGIVGVLSLAIYGMRRWPIPSFGVLFYFASHLLESTTLPLELVHEHRNYIGSVGLLLALVFSIATWENRTVRQSLRWIPVTAILVAFAATTHVRALIWADEVELAVYHAKHHSRSWRSMLGAGAAFSSVVDKTRGLPNMKRALYYYRKADAIKPDESKHLIVIIALLVEMGKSDAAKVYLEKMLKRLKELPISSETMNAVDMVGRCIAGNECKFSLDIYRKMCRSLLKNPYLENNSNYASKVYSANANMAYLDRDLDNAIKLNAVALSSDPGELQHYLNHAMLLYKHGDTKSANNWLDRGFEMDSTKYAQGKIQSLRRVILVRKNQKQNSEPQ